MCSAARPQPGKRAACFASQMSVIINSSFAAAYYPAGIRSQRNGSSLKGVGKSEFGGGLAIAHKGSRLAEGMQDTDLFQLALGLASPWMVTRSGFDAVDGRLDLYVDFVGSRFACAQCGREGCAVHDTKEDTWRHLDFFQHRTLSHARTPRVTCPQRGVRKAATPWARAGSGFTSLFEAYVLARAKTMPIANAVERLGEHDTRLWRIVEHYVWRVVEKLDRSRVRRICRDETSARRGHDYISLFVDMARRKVVNVADGKDAATVKEFADFLEAHGGRREAVTDASIDMGAAFEAGIKENFPNAEITFDKFHVIKLANEAVDQVRREEARNNFQIKGRRYIFLKNVDRLTQEEKEALSRLEAQNLDTIQAMQIGMNLQQLFTMSVNRLAFPRPLERLGSSLRPRADEEAGQDDHGQVGRHPQIDRHRPFQWRSGGDQRQRPGRQAQGQGLPNQTKPQSHRLPHRR